MLQDVTPKPEEKGPILEWTEFETKYRVEAETLLDFKKIAEDLVPKSFVYVQGYDIYFTKGESDFLRYRKAEFTQDERSELTVKMKTQEGNNIIRKEVNLRVDPNSFDTVQAFSETLGYSFEFKIWKMCHIYRYEDATLVCYTVKDDAGKLHNFLEIEVDEDSKVTAEEAWAIIRKYEDLLLPLGINAQKRLRKSLFEMFRKKD